VRGAVARLLGAACLLPLAAAWSAPSVAQSFDHDSSLPIEISADELEVAQEERIATFSGNVDAVQGDLVLSADRLRVHYEAKGDKNGGVAGLGPSEGTSIRRIDADGRVTIASPEETARGDHGVYDVPAKLVTLEGRVVLTRGENVIRGERLELDLVTGKSRMVGAGQAVADGESDASNGRVKALFTPKRKDEEGDPAPRPEARPK
jgi:lipopolysaccharide export system protein LptA